MKMNELNGYYNCASAWQQWENFSHSSRECPKSVAHFRAREKKVAERERERERHISLHAHIAADRTASEDAGGQAPQVTVNLATFGASRQYGRREGGKKLIGREKLGNSFDEVTASFSFLTDGRSVVIRKQVTGTDRTSHFNTSGPFWPPTYWNQLRASYWQLPPTHTHTTPSKTCFPRLQFF